jgi:hypothetical protein
LKTSYSKSNKLCRILQDNIFYNFVNTVFELSTVFIIALFSGAPSIQLYVNLLIFRYNIHNITNIAYAHPEHANQKSHITCAIVEHNH